MRREAPPHEHLPSHATRTIIGMYRMCIVFPKGKKCPSSDKSAWDLSVILLHIIWFPLG